MTRLPSHLLRSALLASVVLAAQAPQAKALVINPVFESSWTSAPAGATTVINNVISEFEHDFSNPVTVNIQFGRGDLNGGSIGGSLGVTNFPQVLGAGANFPNGVAQYSLAQVKGFYNTAVGLQPNNSVLATANANLPASYPNPGGSTSFFVPDAQYKALTGVAQPPNNAIDAYNGYGSGFAWDFSGAAPAAGKFDFTSVAEHEISHALGRVDWGFYPGAAGENPPFLTPLDFFKYTCNTTTLNPTFSQTCFSVDGGVTNPSGRTFAGSSDSGDWSGNNLDSNDAFLNPGEFATFTPVDIMELEALGWDPVPEPGALTLLASSLLGIAWLRRRRR